MLRRTAVILAAGLSLVGCGGAAPRQAADSASRLLDAAVRGDRTAFEALVDRASVREDLRRQVTAVARGATLDVDGGPSEFALDRMISPAAIRLVHAASGQPLTTPPTEAQIAPLMKPLGGGRACLRDAAGACALTFANAGGGWRLVGMKAANLRIELAAN